MLKEDAASGQAQGQTDSDPEAACSRSRGASPTRVKPNGGLGFWDMMTPSQGTMNLEQTVRYRYKEEEVEIRKELSETGLAQPRPGVGLAQLLCLGRAPWDLT